MDSYNILALLFFVCLSFSCFVQGSPGFPGEPGPKGEMGALVSPEPFSMQIKHTSTSFH